jgi:hypothetical protein
LDFNAGTSGDGACILSGKDNPANPEINKALGVLMEPTKDRLARSSIISVIKVIPHAKNNKDS